MVLVAAAAVMLHPANAGAGTAKDKFDRLIAKFVASEPIDGQHPKRGVACACTVALPASPGFLVRATFDQKIYCALPGFSGDGALGAYSYCQSFVVLGR